MADTIIDILSKNASEFGKKYTHNADFRQRYATWTNMLDKYVPSTKTAYDMGCGPGILSFYLAERDIHVTGIDAAPGMIKLCNEIIQQNKAVEKHLRFVEATIPFPLNDAFPPADLIICSSFLEYMDDPNLMADFFGPLLKPKGLLMISLPNRNSLYRKIERTAFQSIKKPNYFRYVKQVKTLEETKEIYSNKGFEFKEFKYYANRSFFSRICTTLLGEKRGSNLFLAVFAKQ